LKASVILKDFEDLTFSFYFRHFRTNPK